MKLLFSAIAFVLLVSCSTGAKSSGSAVTTITSQEHLTQVLEASAERLLLFDLYADWCMPCKILSPIIEEIANENKERVSVYKINVDQHPGIAQAFGVSGIPLVVYVKNKTGVFALSGVQPREAYVRAIDRFASSSETSDSAVTDRPDGKLIDGVRVISLTTATSPGKLYVYRGETVKLVIEKVDFPYSVHIPEFDISQQAEVGQPMEVSFKAKDIGVFPIFCNGKCPTGDGAGFGHIVVMQYEAKGNATFSELTAVQAQDLIAQKNPLILDVRTPQEFYSGFIPNAKLIPLRQLQQRVSEISAYKDKPVLLYCRSGNRSTVAAQILIENGFTSLYNLRPGIKGWMSEGYSVVKQ